PRESDISEAHGPGVQIVVSRFSFPYLRWSRSVELRGIDRDIRLHVRQFHGDLTVGPLQNPAEWYLDAGDNAIVRIIDLGRNAADRSIDETHHPHQQAGIIEIQIKRKLPRVGSLEHSD